MRDYPKEVLDAVYGNEVPAVIYTAEERKALIDKQLSEGKSKFAEDNAKKTAEFNKYHARIGELSPEELAANSGNWLKTLKEKDAMAISDGDAREAAIIKQHFEEKARMDRYFSRTISIHATDLGNSERFIRRNTGKLKYCHDFKIWYIWSDRKGVWAKDEAGTAAEIMKQQVKDLHEEAKGYALGDQEKMRIWAHKCETPARINAALELSATDCDMAITSDKLDTDLMLFNFNNGTYDLGLDLFLPHDKSQNITKTCGYNYDLVAKCPNWEAFMVRIFKSLPDEERKDMIEYLQKAVGYSLTGSTSEQSIFLCHGAGGNGKSVFNEVLRMLFGEYGTTISARSLTLEGDKSIRNDLAGLKGVRFVSASENAKKSVLDEELIKKLSGGEPVQARFLNKEYFTFVPTLKLWWSFNHAPALNDQTESIWRRVRLIPFNETFSDKERIPMPVLLDKFKKELPGIFMWALDGLRKYKKHGLKSTGIIIEAVKNFKDECDVLYEWREQNIVAAETFYPQTMDVNGKMCIGEAQTPKIKSVDLYKNYTLWCEYNNERRIMSTTKFGLEMKERGYKKIRTNQGNVYINIKFLTEYGSKQ